MIIEEYIKILEEEKRIKEKKKEIVLKILELLPERRIEGTETHILGSRKIKLTRKLNRKLDYDAYKALDLPSNLSFVDYKPQINITRLRAIEMVDPDIVSSCVTTSPATPSIKIEEI